VSFFWTSPSFCRRYTDKRGTDREIIDESDVFIDVHKAIRRINPSPLSRRSISTHFPRPNEITVPTANAIASPEMHPIADHGEDSNKKGNEVLLLNEGGLLSHASTPHSESDHPPGTRRSSQQPSLAGIPENALPQLKFLGPANLAGNPKQTKYKAVKIKLAGHQEEHVRVASGVGEGLGQAIQHVEREFPISSRLPAHTENTPQLDGDAEPPNNKRCIARSGSLIERVEHVAGGVPKTVIETTSSSEEDDNESAGSTAERNNGDIEARPLLGR
jgi:metal transporter CNNM